MSILTQTIPKVYKKRNLGYHHDNEAAGYHSNMNHVDRTVNQFHCLNITPTSKWGVTRSFLTRSVLTPYFLTRSF